ncbi:MAG: UDP-glucose 4-epimerase GalE [Acetobacteraceae bacterium]|nr:UDP-glucose 4-epimerase GalE [Acetobacteraceae bacterium]
MTILVTGGAGYIGSHTVKLLRQGGHRAVVYDNLSTGNAASVLGAPLETGDILDGDRLDEVFRRHQPRCVIHFAASAYVGESMVEPEKYYRNNISGTVSLLAALRRHGLPPIVFSSTCATYGLAAELPILETTPQAPINPYGFTKLAIEHALADYGRAYGLRSVAFRYFNAAGADPEGELGEDHDPETHAVPLCIQAALGQRASFSVFGTDYDTPDGSCIRDYIHVMDLASAHVAAAEYLMAGGASDVFNLATGRGTSVIEIVKAVERVTGREVPAQYGPRRAGDPPALYASAAKAERVLGWKPRYVNIDDTVAHAAAWFTRKGNQAA